MTIDPTILLPSRVQHWSELAACVGEDPELWFPDTGGGCVASVVEAKRICGMCEVSTQCLRDALAEEHGFGKESRSGIRGGLNREERAKLDDSPRRVKGQ